MSNIKELRERQEKLVHDARDKLAELDADGIDESRAAEIQSEYDKIMAEHDKLDDRVQRQQRLDEAEARMNEPDPRRPSNAGNTASVANDERTPDERAVFRRWLQVGVSELPHEYRQIIRQMRANDGELRQQATSPGSAGGFTVPTGFVDELMKTMKLIGPMLNDDITRVVTTAGGNPLEWPTMDDTSEEGSRLGENTADSTQDLTFGQKTLSAYKYTSGTIKVSVELDQDTGIQLEQEVRDAAAERIGRIVNKELTNGTGSDQPHGIVTAAGVGTTGASTDSVDFDELIDLYHSVDPVRRQSPRARWMFNDNTLKAIRKLKDGEDRFIWQPADARTGEPATILDAPFSVNQAMDDLGAENHPIVFGDFNRYIVRRVQNVIMVRLDERFMDALQLGFITFGRFDGELLDDDAVKKFANAAS